MPDLCVGRAVPHRHDERQPRSTALPWNIYGDQRDSLALLDHGWIQVYAEDNQEALDLALMAYAVAEDPRSAHACHGEPGRVRAHAHLRDGGRAFARTGRRVLAAVSDDSNRFDFEHPTNIGFSAGPEYNRYFKYQEHQDLLNAPAVIEER